MDFPQFVLVLCPTIDHASLVEFAYFLPPKASKMLPSNIREIEIIDCNGLFGDDRFQIMLRDTVNEYAGLCFCNGMRAAKALLRASGYAPRKLASGGTCWYPVG